MKQPKTILVITFCLLSLTFCFSQNRGRIQIQGTKLEKSDPWSTSKSITKRDGIKMLDGLWKKLSAREQKDRKSAYADARKFIMKAPKEGYCITRERFEKTFQDRSRKDAKARIDIEIKEGCAFSDR